MPTPAKSFPIFHAFDVSVTREIDQVNTRVEDGKTITETTKVTKPVSVPFCLKLPSRMESEEADIVRAVWWTKFMERGVITEALLIKKYTNEGGTLPDEYRKLLEQLQAEFLEVQVKLAEAESLHKDEPDILRPLRIRFFELREKITEIHRSQSPYFENTAEAKARQKHIEWLVLNMSYYKQVKPDETVGEWEPFFVGKTVDEKLDCYDKMVEKKDELLMNAKDMLTLLATFYSSSGGNISSEEISDFLLEDALKTPAPTP